MSNIEKKGQFKTSLLKVLLALIISRQFDPKVLAIFQKNLGVYTKNFDSIPIFLVKACFLHVKKELLQILVSSSMPFEFSHELLPDEVLATFQPDGDQKRKVRLRNFTCFHEALNSMSSMNFLVMGILHSEGDLVYFFLENVALPKELLLQIDVDGNSFLHLICKNPQIGIEVLQKLLLLIRNQFPADEIDFNKFVNFENTQGLKAYDYCQKQQLKGFQNLLSKFYADPNSETSKGGGILIIQAKIGGP
jgi:hypothetical protein